MTSATFSEFYYGYLKKSEQKKTAALEWLNSFLLLNTSSRSARLFAEIQYALEKSGPMIPLFDVLIASVVIDQNATLATTDQQFKRIQGLKLEHIPLHKS